MTESKQELIDEPIVCRPTAETLLLMTGRATVEEDGSLVPTAEVPDSITEAAMHIHRTGAPNLLSRAIEEVTGRPTHWPAQKLGELVRSALDERRDQLAAAETA